MRPILVYFYLFLLLRVEVQFAHNGLLIGLGEAASGPVIRALTL